MEEMYESSGVHFKTLKLDQVYVCYIASILFMHIKSYVGTPKKKCNGGHRPLGPLLCLFLKQYY